MAQGINLATSTSRATTATAATARRPRFLHRPGGVSRAGPWCGEPSGGGWRLVSGCGSVSGCTAIDMSSLHCERASQEITAEGTRTVRSLPSAIVPAPTRLESGISARRGSAASLALPKHGFERRSSDDLLSGETVRQRHGRYARIHWASSRCLRLIIRQRTEGVSGYSVTNCIRWSARGRRSAAIA